jgi:hypothetical protein
MLYENGRPPDSSKVEPASMLARLACSQMNQAAGTEASDTLGSLWRPGMNEPADTDAGGTLRSPAASRTFPVNIGG